MNEFKKYDVRQIMNQLQAIKAALALSLSQLWNFNVLNVTSNRSVLCITDSDQNEICIISNLNTLTLRIDKFESNDSAKIIDLKRIIETYQFNVYVNVNENKSMLLG